MKLQAVPIFRIHDYAQAISFYTGFLGCKIDWEHRFRQDAPVYMQVSKNGLMLQLTENTRFETGVIIFVETEGIRELHIELLNKKSTFKVPEVTLTSWNTKQMELEDPFGNLLRFNENS
jgi:catechol 2,3-dioxygenase-like lactoylglutathione lyase family enzyme